LDAELIYMSIDDTEKFWKNGDDFAE